MKLPKVFVTRRSGEVQVVEAELNRTLMEVIRDDGMSELLALCGGCCSCATCHVYVDPASEPLLPAVSADETALLEGSEQRQGNSRLSCQIRITPDLDGLAVTIAPED